MKWNAESGKICPFLYVSHSHSLSNCLTPPLPKGREGGIRHLDKLWSLDTMGY